MIKLHLNQNTKKGIDDKFIQEVIKNDGILILSKRHKDYEEIHNKYPNLTIMNIFWFIEYKFRLNYLVYIYEMADFFEYIFNEKLVTIRTEHAKEFKVVIS